MPPFIITKIITNLETPCDILNLLITCKKLYAIFSDSLVQSWIINCQKPYQYQVELPLSPTRLSKLFDSMKVIKKGIQDWNLKTYQIGYELKFGEVNYQTMKLPVSIKYYANPRLFHFDINSIEMLEV